MSTVLVTGGSGSLGRAIVPMLAARGHDVRVLSRRPGAGTHVGDLASGEGVGAAVTGADLVVHAVSDTRRAGRTDIDQTRHLVEAVDVEHLVYVSIVGIDSIPYRYYIRKLACEGVIGSSKVPHTILRATQFHELIELVLVAAQRLPVWPLPLDFQFQTIAAREVAARIVELLEAVPSGRAEDIGGPEVLSLGAIIEAWQEAGRRARKIVRLRVPGRVGDAFRRGVNTCPDHASGVETWSEFVGRS